MPKLEPTRSDVSIWRKKSQTTQELLEELGGFKTEIRGQMQVPRIGQVYNIYFSLSKWWIAFFIYHNGFKRSMHICWFCDLHKYFNMKTQSIWNPIGWVQNGGLPKEILTGDNLLAPRSSLGSKKQVSTGVKANHCNSEKKPSILSTGSDFRSHRKLGWLIVMAQIKLEIKRWRKLSQKSNKLVWCKIDWFWVIF